MPHTIHYTTLNDSKGYMVINLLCMVIITLRLEYTAVNVPTSVV